MDPVRNYHERSKHQLDRYAPGPGSLDWASQPEPFRHYVGAPQLDLPLLAGDLPLSWDQLFAPAGRPREMNVASLAGLLQLSLGLSAWKHYGGSRWALRCNPSSGNLHPTEGSLICPELPGLPAGVHHYRPDRHALERRATAPLAWSGGVFVALTGIHWREAWKYGMRAFRYCQHDCGHALAGLSYAAALFGWPVRLLDDWGDAQIAALTGVDRREDFAAGEPESPEALVWIGVGEPPPAERVLAVLDGASWAGKANVLSPEHRDWPDIPAVAAATRKPVAGRVAAAEAQGLAGLAGAALARTAAPALAPIKTAPLGPLPAAGATIGAELGAETGAAVHWPALPALAPASDTPASQLIQRRRSAQAFDGVTSLSAPSFYRLLDALLPRPGQPPWSLSDAPPNVHPVLFVHRVDDLIPGIYCLPRTPGALAELRAVMRPDWLWQPVAGCPDHLPLHLLAPHDARGFAATASCHQDIAADSAFMLAMLARFDDIDGEHPWRYRERFWEAGMLGQVLYLEAEAAERQGTGIGCYFDDVVHHALGIDTERFQDLYHFTVGGALIDERLGSDSGYGHLQARKPG